MTEQPSTEFGRYVRSQLWREDNPAGVRTPPRSMIRAWEQKMDPAVFDLNGDIRRAYRTTYGERLAVQVTVILGVLAGCAIVWTVVWGVMA